MLLRTAAHRDTQLAASLGIGCLFFFVVLRGLGASTAFEDFAFYTNLLGWLCVLVTMVAFGYCAYYFLYPERSWVYRSLREYSDPMRVASEVDSELADKRSLTRFEEATDGRSFPLVLTKNWIVLFERSRVIVVDMHDLKTIRLQEDEEEGFREVRCESGSRKWTFRLAENDATEFRRILTKRGVAKDA